MTATGKNEKVRNELGDIPATASLDEAMLVTGCGLYNVLHMLLSGVILMGVIMQTLALGYVMPAAQCDLALTLQQRGWLAAIPFSAIIVTSYFWGWLADTRGRRVIMLISMVISVFFAVLASFAPGLITFAVLQFLSAVFMSGPTAIVYTFLGEFHNLACRDQMVAFGSSFVGIGTVVLPGVSWLILPLEFSTYIPFLDIYYRPWRLLVVACSIPFAVGSILLYFWPESPKFLAAAGKSEQCLDVLKKIYAINQWTTQERYPVKALIYEGPALDETQEQGFLAILKSMRVQTVPLFKPPLLPWTLLTCFVQFGIFATTNGFYIWLPTILNSLANHDGQDASICNVLEASKHHTTVENGTMVAQRVGPDFKVAEHRAYEHCFKKSEATLYILGDLSLLRAFWVFLIQRDSKNILCNDTMNTETFERSIYIGLIFCSMYIIVGFLVNVVGKKLILIVILSVTGVCGIGANLAPSTKLGVILFAIFQMSGACIGLMNAVAVELFPTKYRAMAVTFSMLMGRAGSMVGSNLIGILLDINCGINFYLFGGLIVVCGLTCFLLPARKEPSASQTVIADHTQNQTHEPV